MITMMMMMMKMKQPITAAMTVVLDCGPGLSVVTGPAQFA